MEVEKHLFLGLFGLFVLANTHYKDRRTLIKSQSHTIAHDYILS